MNDSNRVNCCRKGTKMSSGHEKSRKSSSKRPLNRFEMETPDDANVSTSARKLKDSGDEYDIEVDNTISYCMLNFITVFMAISNAVVCKECKLNVTFTESGKRGLGFKIVISCANCDKKEVPNCPFVDKSYEINRRIILAMRMLGVGLNGTMKFCAFMDLPRPIFQSFYDKVVKTISIASEAVCNKSMNNAADFEKKRSIEKKTRTWNKCIW